MKESLRKLCTVITICFCATRGLFATDNQINTDHTTDENLNLIREWDKVSPQSDKVSHGKVTFRNRCDITLVADMYKPEHVNGKLPAIAINGPFGAVRKQSSGLYTQELAERGFLMTTFDLSYTGESGGESRYVASPGISTEDFCAAIDFLSIRNDVDAEHIGILGICRWGGMALSAVAIDTHIRAIVTSTMYGMSRANANGYFNVMDAGARYELRKQLNEQRTVDTKSGSHTLAGGLPDTLPNDVPRSLKDYYAHYEMKRGYHKRSLNLNGGQDKTSTLSFINMPVLSYSDEIRSAVLIIHGERAHSRYLGEDAFRKLKGDNRELLIIPEANYVDLHNQMSVISFDKIERFLIENFK